MPAQPLRRVARTDRAGGRARGPATGRPPLFSLTAREQEVLALLAELMTNAQLAEVLFISERTANLHFSNIFTKLCVHNRTQAACAATAADLVGCASPTGPVLVDAEQCLADHLVGERVGPRVEPRGPHVP